jgi:hypothetical protein
MTDRRLADLSVELLRQGHSVRFRASGGSMHPTIRPGEHITVVPVAPSDLGLADIILYQARKGILAHRVVGSRRGGGGLRAFIVRGDASESCDAPVGPAQILGKVVLVERAGRRIALGTPRVKFFHLARLSLHRLQRRLDRISP